MKSKLKIILTILTPLLIWRCATVTTPMGGPKDEKPPVLISSSPKSNTKNFKGKTIQLSFDENIKLKDPKEEIIITPSPGKNIDITATGKVLTIEPEQGWKENTTYNINFREAVQDLTEGNPIENLRLAFSTGPIIDSLYIAGNIKDGLTEKIPEKITVAIYEADTFDIFRHTPSYFTKTDKAGNFKLDNLKKGNYHIYAFDDKNKNLKVDSQNEQFGFLSKPLNLIKNKTKVSIPLVRIDTRKLKITKPRSTGDIAFIKFNKYITDYKVATLTKQKIRNSFGDDKSEIILFLDTIENDSIAVNIHAVDSLSQKVDTTVFVKKGTNKKMEEKVKLDISSPALELETGNFHFTIQSSKLIKSVNTDSVILKLDTLENLTFKPEDYKWDTIRKKIEVKTIIDKKKVIIDNTIVLHTGKNFLSTYDNDSLKQTKRTVTLITPEDTGNLIVEATNTSTEDYIIELLSSDYKILQSYYNQPKTTFKYIEPGTYKIRIVIDSNKNKKWDIGNIFQNQEPEKTILYMNREKKYEVTMRANWEQVISVTF